MREPIGMQNTADDQLSRLLVGRVTDPDVGSLNATAYFNFSSPIEWTSPTPTAQFQRIDLYLKFDYYSYGATDSSDMQLQVHELQEQLFAGQFYYNGTHVPYDPVPLGDTTFALGPVGLKNGWTAASDNDLTNNLYFTQRIPLSDAFGQTLMSDMINDTTLINTFADLSAKYKGFAVTMPVGNKILGFTPVYTLPTPTPTDSRLVVTYKEGTSTVTVDFPIYFAAVNGTLNEVTSFTYLESDRSGSAVDGITAFTDFFPSDGRLYAQSGTGIMPKFDLTKAYAYFDTIPFVTINSAELVVENTFTGRTPEDFELLLLDSMNQFRSIYIDSLLNGLFTKVPDPYLIKIQAGIVPLSITADETRVAALNTITGATASVNQETGKVGLTHFTEFFQQIIYQRQSPRRVNAIALHPVETEFNKTVSLLKLDPSSAILRVYYSKPLTGLP